MQYDRGNGLSGSVRRLVSRLCCQGIPGRHGLDRRFADSTRIPSSPFPFRYPSGGKVLFLLVLGTIAVSSTFGAAPLVRGGLELDLSSLTIIILVIQFTGFSVRCLWGRIAAWVGAKRSIITSLVIGSAAAVYAYLGLRGESGAIELALLSVIIAVVLCGSQAISRSFFAQIIPARRHAEFYSCYEVSDRGVSWIGPALCALTNGLLHSLRPAILSLFFFFITGLALLPFVDERKAAIDDQHYDKALF
jgi:UMF1 family MFS transporter